MKLVIREAKSPLLSLQTDPDILIRRECAVTIQAIANEPGGNLLRRWFTDEDLNAIVHTLLQDIDVKEHLIRQVDLGPFKHTVDEGLPSRKASFSLLLSLLRACSSSSYQSRGVYTPLEQVVSPACFIELFVKGFTLGGGEKSSSLSPSTSLDIPLLAADILQQIALPVYAGEVCERRRGKEEEKKGIQGERKEEEEEQGGGLYSSDCLTSSPGNSREGRCMKENRGGEEEEEEWRRRRKIRRRQERRYLDKSELLFRISEAIASPLEVLLTRLLTFLEKQGGLSSLSSFSSGGGGGRGDSLACDRQVDLLRSIVRAMYTFDSALHQPSHLDARMRIPSFFSSSSSSVGREEEEHRREGGGGGSFEWQEMLRRQLLHSPLFRQAWKGLEGEGKEKIRGEAGGGEERKAR
ncbi:heat repeat-containing protein [Cystoisospora suis]|uniref:Heat repeat-containing protein n=1 Tax=Cystoisospora suis TaxID=483139 RepID=A0A2C6JTK5_9APIC|nr:heat repeat-containing protein [Cystoisospora suis]